MSRSAVMLLVVALISLPAAATAQVSAPARAEIVNPPDGSTLTSTTVTFEWSAGAGVQRYYLSVGTAPGLADLYNEDQETRLSATLGGLPADGRPLYLRLSSLMGETWEFNEYRYFAYSAAGRVKAEMLNPPNRATLTSGTVSFEWSRGAGVEQYFLEIGSQQGTHDVCHQDQADRTSAVVSNLPLDGRTLWVRLLSRFGDSWQSSEYVYRAAGGRRAAEFFRPANRSALTPSEAKFEWFAAPGADQYFLSLGARPQPASTDILNQDQGTVLETTVRGLPNDGRMIYARLSTRFGSAWEYADAVFRAAGGRAPAEMTSPRPGSILASSTVRFEWLTGAGADQYYLRIGERTGGSKLYSGDQGTRLEATVPGLPADGRALYVRLSTRFGQTWEHSDYAYRAFAVTGGSVAPRISNLSLRTWPDTTASFQTAYVQGSLDFVKGDTDALRGLRFEFEDSGPFGSIRCSFEVSGGFLRKPGISAGRMDWNFSYGDVHYWVYDTLAERLPIRVSLVDLSGKASNVVGANVKLLACPRATTLTVP